ncbi:MAG: class I SAM-dependent methyltransferase [Hyphomonadaceae bacterium]
MAEFNQADYWLKRHEALRGDPRSVGNANADVAANLRGEAELIATIGEACSLLPMGRVVDLGCGYGRVAQAFMDRGFEYLGVDISPVAIEQARVRAPNGRFVVSDLSGWASDDQYEVVSILYVLIHFVEERRWADFLTRAVSMAKPGGVLLLADEFPAQRVTPAQHVVTRPLSDYEALFSSLGVYFEDGFSEQLRARAPFSCARHFRLARKH